ncbi:putative peroxisomal-coenzyme A synthetase [Favolaschia claudopus]|uniref:Peroxisomal-coenzyme A synthetase n=1 Tax=Favolaschia claudopus TaxID=2862362 RepID=A0AAW0BDD7_9AGAR
MQSTHVLLSPSVLGDLLASQPETAPALILPSSVSLSYGQLVSHVQSLAQELAVPFGQSVALALPNSVELVLAFFAVATLGAINCPLNPGYTQTEFEFYLKDTNPALLLVPQGFMSAHPPPACISAAHKCASAPPRLLSVRPKVSPDSVALVLHTSGTTGRPKAVPLTHGNLLATARNIVNTYALSPADNTYLVQVLFHIHGIVAGVLAPFLSGGRVTLPHKFDPSKTWSEFQRCDCTWITAVPSILQMLLRAPAPDGLRMRFIRSCSSPLSPSTLEQLETRFGVPVLEAYAMTEAAHQMTSNPLPPPNAPRSAWKRKPGSVGIAQGTEIAIYTGSTPAPLGEHGDVCVKSSSVTKGYINNPTANKDAFLPNGFFRTGDRGFLDNNGFLTLVGRNSEIINRGGEKISPIEVDAALLGCSPAIREAVAFAVPDALMGQEVEAAVVVADGEKLNEVTLQGLVGRVLADFKVPKRIHFVEGAIPKGPTGKIQRKNLTELFGRKLVAAVTQSVQPADIGAILKAVLVDLLHVDLSAISDESTLFELGADSIVFIRLVSALRARGINVSTGDLFTNPSVGELVKLLQNQKGEEPEPRPFELLGPHCNDAATDIAAQLGLRGEDIEDAFPLVRGQALMYRAAMDAPNTNTWWIGDVVQLNKSVNVDRWVQVWNTVFENESCMRGTLVGRIPGQDPAYDESVNTAYMSPQGVAPHWVRLHADSRSSARALIQSYAAALRHNIGFRSIHFLLVKFPKGTIFTFLCSHIFLDGGSRELLQNVASALYHRPGTAIKKQGCGPWARYVKHALAVQPDNAFWSKELAPSASLPSFHTARLNDADVIVPLRNQSTVLDLPLTEMSQQLGVSVPLLSESAFCLALSLYWSQISGKMEPAFYVKTFSRRYEEVKNMFEIRGLPMQMNASMMPVTIANHSLWAFVNSFKFKLRAIENLEQSLEHARARTAVTWLWRVQRQVPEWDSLAELIDAVWRPVCPCEISVRRLTPTHLFVNQMQEVWFADEFKQRGCKLELIDIFARTLTFYAEGRLENKTYNDLKAFVFSPRSSLEGLGILARL